MPRDGSGVASKPAGTTASPNTTIESAKFNSVIDDIYADMNFARPITAGGTGATSKQGAVSALLDGTTIVDDDNLKIAANGDQTKLVVLDASLLTTATTRTLKAQDKDGLIAVTSDLAGYINGLEMVNSGADATNDIVVSVGQAASTSSVPVLMRLASALTKRLDANWAAGTAAGMRYSGAAIANGTYHIYLVSKANGADADIYADPSANESTVLTHLQAESGGSAYTSVRRIGSILRESAAIVAFSQMGNEFLRLGAIPRDVNDSGLGTTAVLYTLSVPTGVKVAAIVGGWVSNAVSAVQVLLTSPDQTDQAPNGNGAIVPSNAGFGSVGLSRIRTDTSGRIRGRADAASTFLSLGTFGWIDTRGQ